jgi:hypothetical protein
LHSQKEPRALQAILDRATTDLSFRKRLLVDPRAAIFDSFGVMIPPNFRIKFVERAADLDALIVLPDVENGTGELSDDGLEKVSGGVEETAEWSEDSDEAADMDEG